MFYSDVLKTNWMLKLNPLTKQILNKYSLSHAKTIKERDKVINFQNLILFSKSSLILFSQKFNYWNTSKVCYKFIVEAQY